MEIMANITLISTLLLQAAISLLFIHSAAQAWSNDAGRTGPTTTRKDFLQVSLLGGTTMNTAASVSTLLLSNPSPSNASTPKYLTERSSEDRPLSTCPGQPVKKNCWSTNDDGGRRFEPWLAPLDLSKKGSEAIMQEIEDTIATYPQGGQNSIDGGGWKVAQRGNSDGVYYVRYEFTSMRFKYIDDLEIRVGNNGVMSVRSASREGGFDYGVNATRLNYIASLLKQKGWSVSMI